MSLGHNVSSAEQVDAVTEQAAEAGATVVKAALKTFRGGYAGSFQDPDGHLWEVVFTGASTASGGRPSPRSADTSGGSGAPSGGRSDESRERETRPRVLTHNLMLLAAHQ
jgi:hypothetical protein